MTESYQRPSSVERFVRNRKVIAVAVYPQDFTDSEGLRVYAMGRKGAYPLDTPYDPRTTAVALALGDTAKRSDKPVPAEELQIAADAFGKVEKFRLNYPDVPVTESWLIL